MTHLVRRAAAAFMAAAALAVPAPVAYAQTGKGDIPGVDVRPADPPKPGDPNGGQWFHLELKPGESGTVRAQVSNPAKVAQVVRLAVKDLTFPDDGTATVNDGTQGDIGSWAHLGRNPVVTIPAEKSAVIRVSVTVPLTADPGDHVGVIIGSTSNKQGTPPQTIIRRSATRFYVTVPGEAVSAFEIGNFTTKLDSGIWPSSIASTAFLRNTGRIRLHPVVTIAGEPAAGSALLLSQSNEQYSADVHVPWYGGPVTVKVLVVAEGGLTRTVTKSLFVIPWGLIVGALLGLALLVGAFVLVRRWMRRRVGRVAALHKDVERLERLVTRAAGAAEVVGDAVADSEDDEVYALLSALKRAQRTGSSAALGRLALALHDVDGPALGWLLEALADASGDQREALLVAVSSYDTESVANAARSRSVPAELVAEVEAARAARRVANAAAANSGVPKQRAEGERAKPTRRATAKPAPKAAPKSAATPAKRAPAKKAGTPTNRRPRT